MNIRYKYSRYAMYTNIENVMNKLDLIPGKCLIIGDTLNDFTNRLTNPTLFNMLPEGCEVLSPTYPKVDMQNLPYDNDSFDYVLADQVLEHVRKPWDGVNEVYRVLKPGGLTIITSALLFPVHGVPNDYFRFTPEGLKVLCEKFSIIIQAGGAGNKEFACKIISGTAKGIISPGSDLAKELLRTDGRNIVSVWVIAKK